MQRSLPKLLVLVVLLAGTQLVAARARDPKLALARKHFEAAETYYEQAEFKKALAAYRKAHSYKRFAAFIFNIAQCHRQLKQWNQALFNYRLFLSKKPNTSNRAEVLRRIREMAKQVALQTAAERARGKLTVVTRPAGAQVLIDKLKGKPDGVSPLILKLKAGTHLVAIHRKGFRKVHRQVLIKAGKITLLEVTLPPLVAPRRVEPRRTPPARRLARERPAQRRAPSARLLPPRRRPPLAARQSSPYYERWWFWTGLVLAAVVAGGGTYFGVKALNLSDEWKDKKGLVDDPADHLRQGKEARMTADIMLGTSAALTLALIIGAAVVGMDRAERAARTTRTRILPGCTAQGCTLTLTGRF